MTKKITALLVVLSVSIGLIGVVAASQPALAETMLDACDIRPGSSLCKTENLSQGYTYVIRNVVNILLYIVGVAAVIVIIIAGIRYVTSAGNPTAVTAAKNGIVYAVIGLLLAIIAYGIVNVIIVRFM